MGQSIEYRSYINSPQWKQKSAHCQAMSKRHCIVFFWLRSRHCHHLTYRNLQKEIPVRDTVPLSVTAHQLIHLPLLWKTGARPFVNLVLRVLFIFWMIIFFFVPCTSTAKRKR